MYHTKGCIRYKCNFHCKPVTDLGQHWPVHSVRTVVCFIRNPSHSFNSTPLNLAEVLYLGSIVWPILDYFIILHVVVCQIAVQYVEERLHKIYWEIFGNFCGEAISHFQAPHTTCSETQKPRPLLNKIEYLTRFYFLSFSEI